MVMATSGAHAQHEQRPMTSGEKKVIFASSLGTVFEWYDFYLYGSLAAIIGAQFFNVAGADGKPMKQRATSSRFLRSQPVLLFARSARSCLVGSVTLSVVNTPSLSRSC
jgi:esterase/lipase superfamily enzyme